MGNTILRIVITSILGVAGLCSAFSQEKAVCEKDYVAYLFTYFTGNHISEEAVCYAISMDGYSYWALNDNKPVLDSKVISSTGGVRDPHILRCEDGKTFYMVVTDMVSGNGWDSNRAMVLLKSTDLVNWTHSVINMQKRYEGQEKLKRVWAPQTIFDPEAGKYMVYWSMQYGTGPDVIYYAYANKDFTDLEGEPKPLFVPENKKSCIDGDIVYKDGVYHLFYKTEGHGNGIKVATTHSLTFAEATAEKWQNQFTLTTDNVALSAGESYDFRVIVHTSVELPAMTYKICQADDDANALFELTTAVAANEDVAVKAINVPGVAITQGKLVFDFGGNAANTTVTLSDIILQVHKD